MTQPVALITGAAQRIGACTARRLHQRGFNIAIHFRQSDSAATALSEELNVLRAGSTSLHRADLNSADQARQLAGEVLEHWQRLDLLINNASSFYPTPLAEADEADWDALVGSNLKGPFFLSQALAQSLSEHGGSIINMVDIYASKPLRHHSIYCMAKAGLAMMTQSLAQELAPAVRVNGIAPGAILWPEQDSEFSHDEKQLLMERVPLQRRGEPEDIARTIEFLACDAPYITGQIIPVDGGRSLSM